MSDSISAPSPSPFVTLLKGLTVLASLGVAGYLIVTAQKDAAPEPTAAVPIGAEVSGTENDAVDEDGLPAGLKMPATMEESVFFSTSKSAVPTGAGFSFSDGASEAVSPPEAAKDAFLHSSKILQLGPASPTLEALKDELLGEAKELHKGDS